MSEELVIEIAWLPAEGYYEAHVFDEKREPIKFVTANSDAELHERLGALLPLLKERAK